MSNAEYCPCPDCTGTREQSPPEPPVGAYALIGEILGAVWDDGNASGLDGWTGPGRGSGEIDDEAVRARKRAVRKAIEELMGIES